MFRAANSRWQLRTLSRQTREQARQAEATAEAVRASVYLGAMQTMVSIDQFLADRPRLRAQLYGPQVSLRRHRVDAGAEMLLDMFQMVLANMEHLRKTDEVQGWQHYMRATMRTSPALQDFWRRNRHWYSRPVQEIMDNAQSD